MANVYDLTSSGAGRISTAALVNSFQAITGQCIYYGLDGNYAGSVPIWYFVFDLVGIPANGTITCAHVIQVTNATNTANFAHGPSAFGEHFANGILVVASTTAFPTLTIDTNTKSFIAVDYALEYGMY